MVTVVTELPKDVMMKIMMKFRVKSIARFRCVCKSWQSLINSRTFIQTYLNYATNAYNINVEKSGSNKNAIFYFKTDFRRTTSSFEYQKVSRNAITHNVLDCPPELGNSDCEIMACCDGVLCIAKNKKSIVLWNPSIHDYVVLPPPSVAFDCAAVIGIGYDPIIDDYKVLRAPSKMGVVTRKSCCSVEVLALKSKSWKKLVLDEFPYEVICSRYPTFTDNGLHWFALRPGSNERMILCFDISHEKFREVPQPPQSSLGHTGIYGLRILNRKLCVVDYKQGRFEVWMMTKYGVKESWIEIIDPLYSKYLFPDYIKGENDGHDQLWGNKISWIPITDTISVLLEKRELVIYKPRGQTFEKVCICDPCNMSNRIPYVESLVSPSAN